MYPKFTRLVTLTQPILDLPVSLSRIQNAQSYYFIFLGKSTRIFSNFQWPRAMNPANSLGRQVNCCQTSISQRSPAPSAHPPAQKPDLYSIHSVCRPNYRWLGNGGCRRMPPFRMIYSMFCADSSAHGLLGGHNKEANLASYVAMHYRKDLCRGPVVKSAAAIWIPSIRWVPFMFP